VLGYAFYVGVLIGMLSTGCGDKKSAGLLVHWWFGGVPFYDFRYRLV
jgi:hypothetical protein